MLEWLEKNYKAAVGGLVIVVLLLAAAFALSRSSASKEIAGLNEAKASLEATVASHEKELDETRGRLAELEKSVGASKSEKAALSDALASADKKIVSLQDSVDIRRKAMANMREDIAELKGEVRESLEEIEAFNKAETFQEAALDSLEKELEELKKISSPRVEDALPPSSEALGTVILRMSGLEPFGTIASELKEALPALSGIARNDKKFGEFISGLGTFGDFFGAVRAAAVLLEIDRRPELYVSSGRRREVRRVRFEGLRPL